MALMLPTVHINGTSRDRLLEGYCDAIQALTDASSALALAYPNGRDYYPQGQEAIVIAAQQHEARMAKLIEIRKELMQIAESL